MGDYVGEKGPDAYLEQCIVDIRTPTKNVGKRYT